MHKPKGGPRWHRYRYSRTVPPPQSALLSAGLESTFFPAGAADLFLGASQSDALSELAVDWQNPAVISLPQVREHRESLLRDRKGSATGPGVVGTTITKLVCGRLLG